MNEENKWPEYLRAVGTELPPDPLQTFTQMLTTLIAPLEEMMMRRNNLARQQAAQQQQSDAGQPSRSASAAPINDNNTNSGTCLCSLCSFWCLRM